MTFNFAELQQKVDRLLHNIAEQNRRAYQLFYDPTPQDVELPQLDENGSLITVKIPNRAKIKAEVDSFISGARKEYPFVNLIKREHWRFEKDSNGNFQHPFNFFTSDSVSPTLSFVDMSDSNQRDSLPQVVKDMLQALLSVGWNNGNDWGRGVAFNIAKLNTTGTGGLSLFAGWTVRVLGPVTWGYKAIAVTQGEIEVGGQTLSAGEYALDIINGSYANPYYSWDIGNYIRFNADPSEIYIVAPFCVPGLHPQHIPLVINKGE